MSLGLLSDHVVGLAHKRLSSVEALRHRSNQHEFNGVADLRKLLGTERKKFKARFLYLCDELDQPIADEGFLTWYDARDQHPTRSEYRLYFPETAAAERADVDDLLVLILLRDQSLVAVIARRGSSYERQLVWLFGLEEAAADRFHIRDNLADEVREVDLARRLILDLIGVPGPAPAETHLERMLRTFGERFPRTAVFSHFARETLPAVPPADDPDALLLAWMDWEELLFRTLERHLVSRQLPTAVQDVDTFISYSLSLHNRRKARAGQALEHHTEAILRKRGVRFDRTPRTEGNVKPDFLFPGIAEYRDLSFDAALLTMLGVKSTCKDRWRQILTEAARIREKHLLTLEAGVSDAQTEEMRSQSLRLVVPAAIHSSYSPRARGWLMTLGQFIDLVLERQRRADGTGRATGSPWN